MYDVRNGQRVAPTCPECGCRLKVKENTAIHFWGAKNEYDAAGCKCKLNFEVWVWWNGMKFQWPSPPLNFLDNS